jgi:hypothetical protein
MSFRVAPLDAVKSTKRQICTMGGEQQRNLLIVFLVRSWSNLVTFTRIRPTTRVKVYERKMWVERDLAVHAAVKLCASCLALLANFDVEGVVRVHLLNKSKGFGSCKPCTE